MTFYLGKSRVGRGGAAALGFFVAVMVALGGCGTNSNGALGLATFTALSCGGAVNDVAGCDISKLIATGGKIDLRARRISDSTLLQLRSDFPTVITVTPGSAGAYTLSGLRPGKATIIAADATGDVDHVAMQVDDAAQLSFLTVSAEGGAFSSVPSGDIDGTFILRDGISKFTLLFAQIDGVGNKMIGRETFDTTLSPGLLFQGGKENPTALQFDLQRPAQSGNYSLLIKHKLGPARYKMQITVP